MQWDKEYYNSIDADIKGRIDRLQNTDKQAYVILSVLYATGCRVSELENVPVHKILLDNVLEIPPKKESNIRIINIAEDDVLSNIDKRDLYFYLSIYTASKGKYYTQKYIKRYHIRNTDNQPVTHIFRYLLISRELQLTDNVWEISEILGHKAITTTNLYIGNLL